MRLPHGFDKICVKLLTWTCAFWALCFNFPTLLLEQVQNFGGGFMALCLSIVEQLTRARGDLRMGVPVFMQTGDCAALVVAVEALGPERLTELRSLGPLELALTARRAETLKTPAYDGDLVRLTVPQDANMAWLRALADPADDLRFPMKGPFRSMREGPADLHRAAILLAKSAHLLPAVLAVSVPTAGGGFEALTHLSVPAVLPELGRASPLHPVSAARLPMAAAGAGRVHVLRPEDGGPEHYAIEVGRPDRSLPVLARLHSACFTGDVLGSLKCDCGPQLHAALTQMGTEGAGILLYLNQEGRGIGLANKMRAYSLQDQGFDTVEANHRLGFEDDERDFRLGADILRELGFASVRLLTNNPAKISMMEAMGVTVTERVPLRVGKTDQNAGYLATKAAKSGHLL
jgi:GTP cyclohydrolase II